MYHTPEWYARLRDVGMLWQSLGGVAVFWAGVPKRRYWRWLFALYALASAALLLFSRTHGLLFLEQGSNVYIVYCLSVLLALVCCKISPWAALMVGSSGFLAQQICGSLELTFRSIPAIGTLFDYSNAIVLLDILFFSVGYYLIWRTYHDKVFMEKEDVSSRQMAVFSILALMFSLGFYTVNQYVRGWEHFSPIELTINSLYGAIGSFFLLVMQYDFIKRQRLNTDVNAMRSMLHIQKLQWQQGKEYTELVNEKYHDLKKIINSFRGEIDPRMLNKLSDAIEAYDDQVRTGNSAVDIVLTEARELCRRRRIQFTCYVNGSDLAFMEELDLYAFLKNTVDNAVDAVDRLPEGRERFISLTARNEGGMITLHEENPCVDVVFENGIPQSQQDPDYHGFGMKSMIRIAAKYGGAITTSEKDGVFILDAIFMPN